MCCKHRVLKFKKLTEMATIPKYATEGSAGFDLHSAEDIVLQPKETKIVKTGLSCEIPVGCEMQVRPRSGFAVENNILIKNSPGTIDSDYRGEIGIILYNYGIIAVKISCGDRIAQGIISEYARVDIEETEELSETERGSGGFGSTGTN